MDGIAQYLDVIYKEAGESGGVALADDLIKPGCPLNICGALAAQSQARPVEVLSGIEDIFQGVDQQLSLIHI